MERKSGLTKKTIRKGNPRDVGRKVAVEILDNFEDKLLQKTKTHN